MRKFWLITIIFMISLTGLSGAADDFGTWSSPNSTDPTAPLKPAYDPNIDPFNDAQLSESTTFVCASPTGAIISEEDQANLAEVFLAAASVYDGDFELTGGQKSDSNTKETPPENGGYEEGTTGMQSFIRNEINLLNTGNWAPYDQRKIVRETSEGTNEAKSFSYSIPSAGWEVALDKKADRIPSSRGQFIAQFIDPTASYPLALSSKLPEACALGTELPNEPSLTDFFSSPGKFQSDTVLYIPTNIAVSSLKFFQPYAFRWTFWTPHSEKGDLLWNTPLSCSPVSTMSQILNSSTVRSGCSEGSPLGFTGESSDEKENNSWYLAAANFLQWLISGGYFIMIFLAAILYMFRGNRNTQLQLSTIMPRMLLAMVLTAFSGFLIGMLISFSNTIVQLVFNLSDTRTIGVINNFLLQSGNIIGGGTTIQDVGQLIISASVTVFFAFFVFSALLRQILLIMIIILAPIAAFSLLSPRWQRVFQTYLRALVGVIFAPVLLAFIMKVGISINPLVTDPVTAYGSLQGLVGIILMLITLWLMYKSLRLTFEFVRGGREAVIDSFALGEDNALLKYLNRENRKEDKQDLPALVPADKRTGTPNPVAGQLVPASTAVSSTQPSLPASSQKQSARAINNFVGGQSSKGGPKRISSSQAKQYKEGLYNAVGQAAAQKGERLNKEETEEIKKNYARRQGGKLSSGEDGNFYLNQEEDEIVRPGLPE